GQQPGDRLDDDERGDLPAVEHVVPDRDLADEDVGPARVVLHDAGVDALVAAAGDDDPVGPGELLGGALGEDLPGRGGDEQDGGCRVLGCRGPGRDGAGEHVVQGGAPHVGAHDHPGPAAEGGVVDRAVPVGGPVAQVVDGEVEQPGAPGLADQREVEGGEVVREDRQDVDPHVTPPPG